MAILWKCLSKENKTKLAKWYKKRFRKEFIPPGSKEQAIHVEPKIEDLEEIDRLMRKPGKMPKGAYFRG